MPLESLIETDVLIIEIHVHKAPDLAFLGVEMLVQFREIRSEIAERLAHRACSTFNAPLLCGELAER